MKKIIVLLGLAFLATAEVKSQALGNDYTTAIGVKIYPGAISIKHFVQPDAAIEGLAYFYNHGFRVTGLYEFHGDIAGAPGLKWYAGPGAHIGFYNDRWSRRYPGEDGSVAVGIDGVIGLDFKINGAPLNLSIDWQPSFNIVGRTYFEGGWGGLGVRYTLK